MLMDRFLSIAEVARRTGLSLNTVKVYSQIPGRMPEPDAEVGRVKGWLPETIDAWIVEREERAREKLRRKRGEDT